MPMPTLSSFAADIYNRLEPITGQDAAQGYDLAQYVAAIGEMFQVVDDYARDQEVNGMMAPGWSQLVDPLRCPVEALPWLGQFVGVDVDTTLDATHQRNQVITAAGWQRGTPAAIEAAVAATLTGIRAVTMIEQDPVACPSIPQYGLSIYTRTGETPSPTNTLNAILSQKPAGIILNFQVLSNATYGDLFSSYSAYSGIYSAFRTYEGVYEKQPGT